MEGAILKTTNRLVLEDLPSASGIEIVQGRTFVISDNTPWLYELNKDFEIADTFQIAPSSELSGDVFEKNVKLDFEAMASFQLEGKDHIFIFGSGSKSEMRNKLVWVKLEDTLSSTLYDLSDFYAEIHRTSQIGKRNMNLEGVSIIDDKLFLFNRGDNSLWQFSLVEFIIYIEEEAEFPAFIHYQLQLPMVNDVQAGFSGASRVIGGDQIIFTASLEDTENWIDDGEVLGSYIGFIELDELKDNYAPQFLPLKEDGSKLLLKVESVAIKSIDDNTFRLLLVTDNDDGKSELIKAELNFN